jgi:hypothetical protein
VGEIAPHATLDDVIELRLTLDCAQLVDDVASSNRIHAVCHNFRQQRSVVPVDVELAITVESDPDPCLAKAQFAEQIGEMEHRMLRAAGWVLRVYLDAGYAG